jgi:hypothetical protein
MAIKKSAKNKSIKKKSVKRHKVAATASTRGRAARRVRRPSKADMGASTAISLPDLMAKIAHAHVASAEEKGACLVADQQTGQIHCTLATPDFCKTTLKGTFAGGLCGGQ